MPGKEASVTTRKFLANVTIILAVMAIGAVLEILVPMFVDKPWKRGRRSANLGLTALSFLSNWLLASVAGIAALSFRPAGVLAQRGVPFWAEIVIGICSGFLGWATCLTARCTCGRRCGDFTGFTTATRLWM